MGEFEQLVLLAILRRGDDAYGMEIVDEIARRTGREVSYGAVYTTLDRLERKEFVAFRMGDPSPTRGGRARKYFRVQPEGRRALLASRAALGTMWEGVSI